MAKMNVILEFLWSNVILLFMFLFMTTFSSHVMFYCCNECVALTRWPVKYILGAMIDVFLAQCPYISLVLNKFRGFHMYQLTYGYVFLHSFNMKNKMDLLHFGGKRNVSWIYCILGKKLSVFKINLWKSKSGF